MLRQAREVVEGPSSASCTPRPLGSRAEEAREGVADVAGAVEYRDPERMRASALSRVLDPMPRE